MNSNEFIALRPSELVRTALKDLRSCEKDGRYEIFMGTWHSPDEGVCEVCLAGAVMAKTLGADPDFSKTPWDYDDLTKSRLNALEHFRQGLLTTGLLEMGIAKKIQGTFVRNYGNDSFYQDMEKVIRRLEKAGQ